MISFYIVSFIGPVLSKIGFSYKMAKHTNDVHFHIKIQLDEKIWQKKFKIEFFSQGMGKRDMRVKGKS